MTPLYVGNGLIINRIPIFGQRGKSEGVVNDEAKKVLNKITRFFNGINFLCYEKWDTGNSREKGFPLSLSHVLANSKFISLIHCFNLMRFA